MKSYPFKFIHVGLGKCASSYLQSVWGVDSQYRRLDISGVVEHATVLANDLSCDKYPAINLDMGANVENQCHILSSEGFTFAFINELDKRQNLAKLYQVSANLLGLNKLSDSVLILVRDPVDWLKSAHGQTIKEGASWSYASFFQQQRGFIESSLNIELIYQEFSAHFSNVVILSADTLKKHPEDFWSAYGALLGAPIPMKDSLEKSADKSNKGLDGRLYKLAKLNRYNATLKKTFGSLASYQRARPEEAAHFEEIIRTKLHWFNRRISEFADDEGLSGLANLLKDVDDVASFDKVFIDKDMQCFIEKHYLQPLRNVSSIPSDVIDGYSESLKLAVG